MSIDRLLGYLDCIQEPLDNTIERDHFDQGQLALIHQIKQYLTDPNS